MATGDIFSFYRGFFFRSPYIITLSYLLALFSLYNQAVLSSHIMRHLRGVVLGVVPPICVLLPILTHSLQETPLMNKCQLTLPCRAINLYLLVAPSCTYLRPVLVLFLEGGIHHLKMQPKWPRSILLTSLPIYFLGQRYSRSVAAEWIFLADFWVTLRRYDCCWWKEIFFCTSSFVASPFIPMSMILISSDYHYYMPHDSWWWYDD